MGSCRSQNKQNILYLITDSATHRQEEALQAHVFEKE